MAKSKSRPKSQETEAQPCAKGFPQVKTGVAGIDVGAKVNVAAISGNVARAFSPLSCGLKALAERLVEHGITEAAMEATGVYWAPLYNVLEMHGIKPVLLDPQSLSKLKKVNKANEVKDDFRDAKSIQKLWSHGFGNACFVPDAETAGLRELVRARAKVVAQLADLANRMIKILRLMNINLEMAVTDVQGKTGMNIISAIVQGERDPDKLATLRDPRR